MQGRLDRERTTAERARLENTRMACLISFLYKQHENLGAGLYLP